MLEELPQGWVETTLGEIVEPSRERALPKEVSAMPYIGLEHIEPHTMKLLGHGRLQDVRSSSLWFSKGEVLYGRLRPYLNKVWVAEFDGLCSAEFLVFSRFEEVDSQYLALRLNAEDFVAFASGKVSGERPRVDFEKLSAFPVLLPPVAEQERIVEKVNRALSLIARGATAALRASNRLKLYRNAVLQAAVSGELTSEWRDDQQNAKSVQSKSGEALLRRILAARRRRWEEVELNRLRGKGRGPRSDGWKARYIEPAVPDSADLPDFPKEWALASLDMVAEIGSGISVSQKRIVKDPVEVPYLRVANVMRGYLDLTELKTIRVEEEKLDSYLLEEGDALFTEGGDRDKLGRGWIWESQIPRCVHQNHVFRARLFDRSLLDSRLVSHWGNTFGQQFFLIHGVQTTNLASINRNVLKRLPVPIPPRDEQIEIIREIDRRLAAADRLAATITRQIDRARIARDSVLREGFAGNLTSRDPSDKPVAVQRFRARGAREKARQREVRYELQADHRKKRLPVEERIRLCESLKAAWEAIGRKADALRLFEEAAFGPDQVVQFYEALRATSEVRAAFQSIAQRPIRERGNAKFSEETEGEPQGRFRLVDLWLEDFKNLKDYSIRFDPSYGTDVVLGWNGTGKSNLFEVLVTIFRDLHEWSIRNHWPDKPMNGFRLRYEIGDQMVEVTWRPHQMKRPELQGRRICPNAGAGDETKTDRIKRDRLPLPRFVFGYYSGPTNRLAELFLPMNQAHYDRLRKADSDDAKTLQQLLEQRRFFCAETHHAKYVLLAFSYKEDAAINEFLEKRLRITGFESALFVVRRPPWAKPGSSAADFWGATGIMRKVMERLRSYSLAPIVLRQTVSAGYRLVTEDLYYFFLPDLPSLHAFAAEYPDARTFFLALESTDFSELIYDVRIQVRVKAANSEQVSITFHQLSEGEQQLLMVLGLMRFTKSHQSLVLLDEPDTHLNPHWSVHYLKDLGRAMSDSSFEAPEQQTSQTLMATHDPLVIASLVKEQIHLLKRDSVTGVCKWATANIDPRGLGFTGILTSEMFGFRSDLDPETLGDLDNRVRLVAKDGPLDSSEMKELEDIDKRLSNAGFLKAFSDPYYAAFVRAWGRRQSDLMAGEEFLTPQRQEEIDRIAREVLSEAVAEVEREIAD